MIRKETRLMGIVERLKKLTGRPDEPDQPRQKTAVELLRSHHQSLQAGVRLDPNTEVQLYSHWDFLRIDQLARWRIINKVLDEFDQDPSVTNKAGLNAFIRYLNRPTSSRR